MGFLSIHCSSYQLTGGHNWDPFACPILLICCGYRKITCQPCFFQCAQAYRDRLNFTSVIKETPPPAPKKKKILPLSHLKEKFNYNRGCMVRKKKSRRQMNMQSKRQNMRGENWQMKRQRMCSQLTGKTRRYKDVHTFESKSLFYCTSPGLHLLSICRKEAVNMSCLRNKHAD